MTLGSSSPDKYSVVPSLHHSNSKVCHWSSSGFIGISPVNIGELPYSYNEDSCKTVVPFSSTNTTSYFCLVEE